MKIEIYLRIPSHYEDVEKIKSVIGESIVDGFSLSENGEILKGKCKIASNESYNYHNNYDDSEDVLYFNNKKQWFTLSENRIKEVYEENRKIILDKLQTVIDKFSTNEEQVLKIN